MNNFQNKINILFLGGSKKNSLVDFFKEEASKRNISLSFFSYELNQVEPIGKVATILIGKKWGDPFIEDDLIEKISNNNINIVIPFVDIATVICSRLSVKMPHVFFVISPLETNLITYDKKKLNSWFLKMGFDVPSTDLQLPLIAKPKSGSGAKGFFYINSKAELDYFFATSNLEDYFIQQKVEGIEYSIDCYVDFISNQPVFIVPRKRIEVINGEATRTVTEQNDVVANVAADILSTNIFKGPVTIQLFLMRDSKSYRLIEINPRIGSGAYASIYAGANYCTAILNNYLNISNELVINWKSGVLMTRTFKEYYFYADNN